ncbi:unnamed protein product, partial [Choristocarpus tenellus]
LQRCSLIGGPNTGWLRDGYCRTCSRDTLLQCVCCEVTSDFLDYSRKMGDDLTSPDGYFPGLKPGDRWCLRSDRWLEAFNAGKAPKVVLESTHERAMLHIPLLYLEDNRADREDQISDLD